MKAVIKLSKNWVVKKLPDRPLNSHKGTFGKVLVFAGSENYPGAAYLACAACLRVGVGLVTLVTDQSVKLIISKKLPEATFLSVDQAFQEMENYNVCLIGPGLGQKANITELLRRILQTNLKVVIDADGLNILSKTDNWWNDLGSAAILTPHPGEMSRLTGLKVEAIQADRIKIAQRFAKKWNKVVVLKGANTVIAASDSTVAISPFANPVLATAGTGDVLAGVITGFLAQKLQPFDAACAGVYIHGLTGERLSKKIGKAGGLASDLLLLLPQIINKLV